jgi:hypothetical protein
LTRDLNPLSFWCIQDTKQHKEIGENMAYEYGIEYTLIGGADGLVNHGRDLHAAIDDAKAVAKAVARSDLYRDVSVVRRQVGEWESFCIKDELDIVNAARKEG